MSDPYYTTDADFGDETHYWHGVDVNFNARLRSGVFLQAGTSTGRGVNDTCDVLTARFGRPMTPTAGIVIASGIVNGQPTCDATEPWLTQVRALGSYTVPKVDVLVQRDLPIAAQRAAEQPRSWRPTADRERANYQMTPAQFLAATGVPLRAGLAQQSVDLLRPGAVYGDRINVLDLRLAKVLRFGEQAPERRAGPLQPVQREHRDGV